MTPSEFPQDAIVWTQTLNPRSKSGHLLNQFIFDFLCTLLSKKTVKYIIEILTFFEHVKIYLIYQVQDEKVRRKLDYVADNKKIDF